MLFEHSVTKHYTGADFPCRSLHLQPRPSPTKVFQIIGIGKSSAEALKRSISDLIQYKAYYEVSRAINTMQG